MKTNIWWIRRDLRLSDNPALYAATEDAEQVIPLFIIDPKLVNTTRTGVKRLAFLYAGLRELNASLRSRGGRLFVRHGEPATVLEELTATTGSETVYAEADFSPYSRNRDRQVSKGVHLELVGGSSYSHPSAVLKQDGTPYTVFTPYMRTWKGQYNPRQDKELPAPTSINVPDELDSVPIPTDPAIPRGVIFKPGEGEAQERLKLFTRGESPAIYQYTDLRNRIDLEGTSQLSPYLRFGMLSARQAIMAAYHALDDAQDEVSAKGAETWLNELIWREFYIAILYHFPNVLRESFRPELRSIQWVNDPQDFDDWCEGRTGYPVVDAAMRQLRETGWMHNRARMIVASFLVKDLLIDWRWGEAWFMQHLVDGDPAANNGGWQWTAGTGTDAAPYFRIFNPVLQSQKFDPDGVFIRRWIPELSQFSDQPIHTPWKTSAEKQSEIGVVIGHDYPKPIIDHSFARERTLEAYKAASGN